MANIRKVLAQLAPASGGDATLYTVPASTDTVISSLVVCNRGSTEASFRVSIQPGGGAVDDANYIYYDVSVAGNDTFAATLGITLAQTDVVTVYVSDATLSFNLFGQENT